ncbi:IRK-interacting protein [Rosa sericea]
MAPSSSSPSSKSPPPPTTTYFTPIQEEDGNESTSTTTPNKATPKHHNSTPLHYSHKHGKRHGKKRSEISAGSSSATREEEDDDDMSVNCNKCRPNAREKISVVPLDNNNGFNRKNGSSSVSMASPNGILKSILSSFTRKSPKLPMDPYAAAREEKWKVAVAELSQKLIQTTRKKDEALLEASRLKYSMAELEKKLNKLEVYCHGLKSGLEECSSGNSPYQLGSKPQNKRQGFSGLNDNNKAVVEHFLVAVSEARTSVRLLSRSLTMQLRHMAGSKVYDKITALLQPYDIKLSLSKNPRSLLFYLEALLNKTFFDEFESPGFCKNSANHILNPVERCEANYASFELLRGLTWDEVLIKGTRHFSEEFSRFCDRKMSEIVAMLGWNRAWPEPLLQAFFGASKSVWLVHLLATSVHPSLPVFRVESGVGFDPVYMEDMGGDKARKLVPSVVRIMVAPGFYVYGSVVKCKVLCRYNSNSRGLTHSSP